MVESSNEVPKEEKPFLSVIVHSFFIIPFLIVVFGLLLFGAMQLLTHENRSVYDYLEDVKTGAQNKRWQGAFELSKILANPKLVPKEERFKNEVTKAFEQAKYDNGLVRQYLALAMGRSGLTEFSDPLINALKEEKEENLPALIYALGMLKEKRAVKDLIGYIDHPNSYIRSTAVVSLGNIAEPSASEALKKALNDPEPNVTWGAAISLAQMGYSDGKTILMQLLERSYLSKFKEVDWDEQNNLMMMAVDASAKILDPSLKEKLKNLSTTDPNMKIRSEAIKHLK